jgi:hypothetical protein
MSDYVSRVLVEAADYIDQHGWVQRHYFDTWTADTPKACASGAIWLVAQLVVEEMRAVGDSDFSDSGELRARAEEAIMRLLKDRDALPPGFYPEDYRGRAFDTVVTWNDEEGRTKDQVVQVLRDAARDHA